MTDEQSLSSSPDSIVLTDFRLEENTRNLETEAGWLASMIKFRIDALQNKYLRKEESRNSVALQTPPALLPDGSPYAHFILHNKLLPQDRLLLILSLVNHINPALLIDAFQLDGLHVQANPRPEWGLIRGQYFKGFLPSGLTYIYVMGGNQTLARLASQEIFYNPHFFGEQNILGIEPHFKGEPSLSGRLVINERYVEYLLFGKTDPSTSGIKYSSLSFQ